nr:oligosaccharide flippase family protein [uncultured Flavobacterium sp.]
MSKYKRLGKNTFLVFLGNVGSKLIGFIMLPFYTKWLSVEEFGASDNVLVYVGLLLAIVTLSISDSIFIFPKDKSFEEQKQYFSSGLLYSSILLCISGLLLYGINQILISIKILESVTRNMVYIYLLLISYFFQTFFQQFSRSINKINVYTISGVVLAIFIATFSFILIPKYGVSGFFVAQICSYFFTSLYCILHAGLFRFISLKAIKLARYYEMAKFSIPLIPNALMWWLIGSLNRPLMEEHLGLHAIGLFAIAYKLPSLINVFFSVIMLAWQISVLEEFKKEDYEKFYNNMFRLVFTILSFSVIMLSVLSKPLIEIISTPKFIEASNYIPLLAFSVLFSSVSGFVGINFSAIRESKFYFYSSIWGAAAAVIFNFILIPIWGLYGVVFSIVFSNIIMAISRILYSWKIVKITNVFFYLLILFICLSIVLILSFSKNINMIVFTVLAGTIIFGFLVKKDIMIGIKMINDFRLNKKN